MNGFFPWWSAGTLQVQQMADITDITFLFSFLPVPLCSFCWNIDVFVRQGQPREVASVCSAFMAFGFAPLGHQQVELAGTDWNWLEFGDVPRHAHDMPMTF